MPRPAPMTRVCGQPSRLVMRLRFTSPLSPQPQVKPGATQAMRDYQEAVPFRRARYVPERPRMNTDQPDHAIPAQPKNRTDSDGFGGRRARLLIRGFRVRAPGAPPTESQVNATSGTQAVSRCVSQAATRAWQLLCLKGLLDFLEDVLQLLQLGPQLVDPHADVGEPQVGVLLGGDRHVAEAAVLVGETLEVLVCGDRRLRLPRGTEVPGGRPRREHDRRAECEEQDAVHN